MDLSPHHVGIIVSDLARSKEFYGVEIEIKQAD